MPKGLRGEAKLEEINHIISPEKALCRIKYSFDCKLFVKRIAINPASIKFQKEYTLQKGKLHYLEENALSEALMELEKENVVVVDFVVGPADKTGSRKFPLEVTIHSTVLFKHMLSKTQSEIYIIDPNTYRFSSFLEKTIPSLFGINENFYLLRYDLYSNQRKKNSRNILFKNYPRERDCVDISSQVALRIKERLILIPEETYEPFTTFEELIKLVSNQTAINKSLPQCFTKTYLWEYLSWNPEERKKCRKFFESNLTDGRNRAVTLTNALRSDFDFLNLESYIDLFDVVERLFCI